VSTEAISVQGWEEPERHPRPLLEDLTVVVPARNAEHLLDECLDGLRKAGPAEVIVVDGQSGDETARLARALGARVLSDEGRGLPAARALGARSARTRYVALVDADVVIPDGALEALLEEYKAGGYTALQAGLHSTGGPGYWGRALAYHHRNGRSKNWFGVVATIFERHTLLEHGFALLARHAGQGLAHEAAQATLTYARDTLGLARVVAITDADNARSAHLLKKLGMRYERTLCLTPDDEVLLYARALNPNSDAVPPHAEHSQLT